MNKQQEYIKKIEDVSAVPLKVANLQKKVDGDYKPGYRYNVGKYEIHDERNVLLNEIVFDLDWKSYVKNFAHAKLIIESLQNRKIPFYIYSSGGKGIHIHIYFEKLDIEEKEHKEIFREAFSYNYKWKDIRVWLWNTILDESGIDVKLRGVGKYLDIAPIKFDYFNGTSHLIRDCGGRKIIKNSSLEYETTYKTYIPIEEFKKQKPRIKNFANVLYPEVIETFTLDLNELCLEMNKYVQYQKDNHQEPLINVKLPINYVDIDSVLKIREGMGEGKRSSGAMMIAIACKIDQLPKKDAIIILEEYVKNCSQLGASFSIHEAEYWLHWIYNQQHVFWNCSQLKDLEVHGQEVCEFCQIKNKKAIDFLKSTTMLDQIIDVLEQEIVGEKHTSVLIFILLLSKDFPSTKDWKIPGDPMSQNVILASDSSSGKSYVAKRIMKLFGEEDEDYLIISRMSKSVINYYTEIDMDGKIIFIEEMQGLDENTDQLRVWMSEGKLKFETVEKVIGDDGIEKNTKVTKTTIGQPSFITCQAEGKVEDQLNNRSWVISMDITDKQTKDILKFQDRLNKGEVVVDSSRLRIIKDALKQLKPYHFIIPFMDYEILNIPINDVRARRDYDKFATLIKDFAYLHQYQREIITKNDREFIICDIKDYELAKQYSQHILGATFTGLTLNQIDLINYIRQSTWKTEFTVSDIMRNKGKSHTHWHGEMSQLENLGFVIGEKSLGKSTVYSLVDEKALNIINLPSGEELLKMVDLKVQSPDDMKKPGKTETPKTPDSHVKSGTHFKVYPTVKPKQDPVHLKVAARSVKPKMLFRENKEHFLFSHTRSGLRYEDVENYVKNHKNHLVDIEDIIEKFGENSRELIDSIITTLKNRGTLCEAKPGRLMVA